MPLWDVKFFDADGIEIDSASVDLDLSEDAMSWARRKADAPGSRVVRIELTYEGQLVKHWSIEQAS